MNPQTLAPEEAKAYYDRFGSKQDSQEFYEGAAVRALVEHSQMHQARAVFEVGCGTGRFAEELLEKHLPAEAHYIGIDISSTMIQLASERLARFGEQAAVQQIHVDAPFPVAARSIDRLVSTYVLDLLSPLATETFLGQARNVLQPGGLLCLASITQGVTSVSKLAMDVWQRVFQWKPAWVGGCRPIHLAQLLAEDAWQVQYRTVIVRWGIASEVVVATPKGNG